MATYFAEHYKIALKYPDLPCVACGSSKRLAYFPLEVCHVPAQRQQLLQDSQASASMIKVTALPPAARRRAIEDQVVKHIEPDPGPKAFNVRVNRHMAGVSGRVLDPPRLFTATTGSRRRGPGRGTSPTTDSARPPGGSTR